MKRKLAFIGIVIAFYTLTIKATTLDSKPDSGIVTKGILVGYWGDISFTQGVQIGLEQYLVQTAKYGIIISPAIGFQRQDEFYSSVGLWVGSSLRRTFSWGLFLEHGLKLGYLGSYYDFDFYKLNSDEQIVNIGRKWTSSVTLGYFIGLGFDFSKCTKSNIRFFIRPNYYYRIPNNNNVFYFNNFGLDAGFSFYPKWLR